MSEQGDRARKVLHDLRWGPHIEDVIERQEKMDDAIRVALGTIFALEEEVEGLHTHADLVESDRDALLAVVRAGKALNLRYEPKLKMWILMGEAAECEAFDDALAALPEHLKNK
jgi:hypothetical protein